ncbi:hypothetical protein ACHAWF_008069 [Thalassiosira exigua]
MDVTLPLTPQYTQLSGLGGGGLPPSPGDDGSSSSSDDLFATYAVAATLAFSLVVYLFESYLSLRQRRSYHKTEFPSELEGTVGKIDAEREREKKEKGEETEKEGEEAKEGGEASSKEKVDRDAPLLPQLRSKFAASQSYGLEKVHFSLFSSTYGTFEGTAFVLWGFLPYVWDLSCRFGNEYFGWTETNDEIKVTLIFMSIVTIVGTITSLPFEWYSTFRIEKRHGFNKQTPALFVTDKIKGLFLTAIFGGPFLALLLRIIKWGGESFYLYVWAFTFVFSVIMMTLVPVVIMPMFNKYEPLPEGTLKEDIHALAGRLEFPLTKLFVMDGSKRSSHSNAFMFGFFKNKRIVLFDTLMQQVHNNEILAILGHELGHWKMGHIATFVISQLYMGAAFYCFSLCYTSHGLYRAFGFDDTDRPVPTIIALLLFLSTVFEPIDKALSYAMTVHSRKCEFKADEFSVNLRTWRTWAPCAPTAGTPRTTIRTRRWWSG